MRSFLQIILRGFGSRLGAVVSGVLVGVLVGIYIWVRMSP